MYIVHRALIGGLEPGPSAGKGGLKGVFAYRPVGNSIALSSAGYAVYSDLASNGLYFSPRFELAVNTQAAAMQGVKMSAGHSQYALPLGYFYITGLWIHCISGNDVMNGKTAVWTLLDDWHPECELATKRRPQDTHDLPDSVFQ